jgi:hypothetical protein
MSTISLQPNKLVRMVLNLLPHTHLEVGPVKQLGYLSVEKLVLVGLSPQVPIQLFFIY